MRKSAISLNGSDAGDPAPYGFTPPNIPKVSETEPTFSRQGSHVLVGRGGVHLKRKFVSSHKTKQALTP